MVADPRGDGWVVAVGGAGAFVNDRLDSEDNAALAANIAVPQLGHEGRVPRAREPGDGRGRQVARRISCPRACAWRSRSCSIAFVVFALWRGRRLGRPVAEVQPVEIAGSELVVAVGNLLQKAGRPEIAAERLRTDLHHDLRHRLGLPVTTSADVVADLAAARHRRRPRPRWRERSPDRCPPRPTQLVTAARDVEQVRTAVLGSRA